MYATPSDLTNRYSTDAAILQATQAEILTALQDATDEVDSYLATRYSSPLAVVPGRIVGVTCDIANYRLIGDAALMTDERRRRYEDAVRWLEKCAKGDIDLTALVTVPVDADGDGNPDPATPAEITYSERLFTRSSLAGVL